MERTFTDTDFDVQSFHGSSPNKKTETRDLNMATTEVISVDQISQVVERHNAGVQTEAETNSTEAKYDEAALLECMRRLAPKVEAELRKRNRHFGSNFQRSLPDDEDMETKKVGVLPRYEKVGEIKSKQVVWSCYGNKIAISFGYVKHETWCTHSSFILIYESDKNEEFVNDAKECIEINTCVMDMKFHPTVNSVLVFASEEGRIYWHNTTDSLESNSQNYIQCESMKITRLSWVELNSCLYLAVADSEGFLDLWNTSSYIKDWTRWRRFTFTSPGGVSNDRAVVCFDFSTNPQHFVVALEGGSLLQCSTILTSSAGHQPVYPVVSDFQQSSPITNDVSFSKFEENVFAVSFHDHYLKVYRLNQRAPDFSIALDRMPLGMEWSYSQETIVKVWFADGEIRHYHYRECQCMKSVQLENSIQTLSFKIKGYNIYKVDTSKKLMKPSSGRFKKKFFFSNRERMQLLCVAVDVQNQASIWRGGLFVK